MGDGVTADIEILDQQGALIARLEGQISVESESLIEEYKRNRLNPLPFPTMSDNPASAI